MYLNYGDLNFFEHGRLVDTEHSDTEIQVLFCEPYSDQDDLFQFAACSVDLEDSWIDWNAVRKWSGDILPDRDPDTTHALLATAAIEYYGVENFSSPYNGYDFTRKEIQDQLKYYMIAYDNLCTE